MVGTYYQFSSPHIKLVILRRLLLTGSTVFNFIALQCISMSITSTIMFVAPIIIYALSGLLLGEHVGRWRWIFIIASFIGVIIAIRLLNADFHWVVLSSLATVTMYFLSTILTRKLANQVPTVTLQFSASAVGSAVLLPFGLYLGETPPSSLEWLLLLVIGGIVWGCIIFGDILDSWTILCAAIIVASGLLIWLRERKHDATNAFRFRG